MENERPVWLEHTRGKGTSGRMKKALRTLSLSLGWGLMGASCKEVSQSDVYLPQVVLSPFPVSPSPLYYDVGAVLAPIFLTWETEV